MPLTPGDLEQLRRMMREEALAVLKPTAARIANHSGQLKAVHQEIREEVSPAVAKRISDAEFGIADKYTAFERLMLDGLAQQRQETADLAAVVHSIPPGIASAERAAQLAEGKTTALIANSDTADAQRQKNGKKLTGAIVLQVLTFGTAVAALLERLLHAGSP